VYRQGDVRLIPIDPAQLPTRPAAAHRDTRGRLSPAHGEATGHAHVVTAPTAQLLADPDQVDRRFLLLATRALRTHDEHAPIPLPAGAYRVVRQREYPPKQVRDVAD
jgi:hypothetical protein